MAITGRWKQNMLSARFVPRLVISHPASPAVVRICVRLDELTTTHRNS